MRVTRNVVDDALVMNVKTPLGAKSAQTLPLPHDCLRLGAAGVGHARNDDRPHHSLT